MRRTIADPISPEESWQNDADGPYRIRVMSREDLPRVIEIDHKVDGRERPAYFEEKFASCVSEPGINISLVADADDHPVGFLIAQLYFGEFGIPAMRAVLHTIGVHPAFAHQGVAHALMEQFRRNMTALRVETISTLVELKRIDLIGFFQSVGFQPSREIDLVWDTRRYPFRSKSSPVLVDAAGPMDLGGVTEIDREYLQGARPRYFARKLEGAAQHPHRTFFLVGRLSGEVAGFLVAGLFQGEFGIEAPRGVIDSFGVREKFRHRGVASALMEHLLGLLHGREVAQIETVCRWNEWDLLQFFEYTGFRPSRRLSLEWRFS
jgi:ribosomal protein S18 acetylase RimI-like enzyme